MHVHLTFDASDDVAAPFLNLSRPKVAILREQGVNSHVEMAYAFTEAGFEAFDVHMTDLQTGRVKLEDFQGVVACGGFSYGDTLGAGIGWARSITFNPVLAAQFQGFFGRTDTFGLGVCNGCQMFAELADIIPGAQDWPRFTTNQSERFEARLSLVEVLESPSLFLQGMAGSRLPIAVAHGEGYANFKYRGNAAQAIAAMRFVDNHGAATEQYPFNPNGSAGGLTAVTTADGRFTAMMPHPERVFRNVQMSWTSGDIGALSPWMRIWRNARKWVGKGWALVAWPFCFWGAPTLHCSDPLRCAPPASPCNRRCASQGRRARAAPQRGRRPPSGGRRRRRLRGCITTISLVHQQAPLVGGQIAAHRVVQPFFGHFEAEGCHLLVECRAVAAVGVHDPDLCTRARMAVDETGQRGAHIALIQHIAAHDQIKLPLHRACQ
jgi:phosphoribosylformylglycinamidine (FGAM) synthase-like amidotransferase family enzyme